MRPTRNLQFRVRQRPFIAVSEVIVRERTHLSVAGLTMTREDGSDDLRKFGATVGTGGGLCAAGDARGMSTE